MMKIALNIAKLYQNYCHDLLWTIALTSTDVFKSYVSLPIVFQTGYPARLTNTFMTKHWCLKSVVELTNAYKYLFKVPFHVMRTIEV